MTLYACTIFASAFLLFLLQPIVAKEILPWFGGSSAVWTTCLVFFQSTLLLGYGYADALIRKVSPSAQLKVHGVLLAASLLVLPIIPGAMWKPIGTEAPVWLILGLLAATVGLPYFILSTTSPLLQAWFGQRFPGRSPYRLFALSNFASLLGLVSYPFLVEPYVPTRVQAYVWSAAYAIFALLCAGAAWTTRKEAATSAIAAHSSSADARQPPSPGAQLMWIMLAATASILLLAVSNHICQNISSIPLLWILPLSVYLLTFIICFDSPRWYHRPTFMAMAAAALGVMAFTLADRDLVHELTLQIGVFVAGLFIACMFCHGELAYSKPAPRYLTRFYFMIALGGAMGAACVGILAPLLLPAYFEPGLGLIACAALLVARTRRSASIFIALASITLLVAIGAWGWSIKDFYEGTVLAARNFYGVLRVQRFGEDTSSDRRSLVHGTILHGTQYQASDLLRVATTYYTESSGIGRVIEGRHPSLKPLRVGVVGLGTGTIAVYGSKGDVYRFYDINPAVVKIAQSEFTFLRDSEATIEIALGDARLSLEREAPQRFDVLAIDAFSSDSIPVHLITVEALQVYRRHMADGGVIAFHVTNRFLDLVPVVQQIAEDQGLHAMLVADDGEAALSSRSDWVLVASDTAVLTRGTLAEFAKPIAPVNGWRRWTDDFNNIVQVLK